MSELSWYRKVRLRTIETLAFWRGRINSRDLVEIFGISRIAALGDIHRYMEHSPGNLIYRGSEKAYIATSTFKNQLTSGVVEEWMALDAVHCQCVVRPQFMIQPEHARPLIKAIRGGSGVTVMYRSLEQPEGTKQSLFPHMLIYSGFRWHVRAWCCMREGFRDFNISRIAQVNTLNIKRPPGASPNKDISWIKMVDILLVPNPSLDQQRRSLIEAEYRMRNGQLKVNTRAALVKYTLRAYQVASSQDHEKCKPHLVLANAEDIEESCNCQSE